LWWFTVDPALEYLYHMEVVCASNISEDYTASIFRVKMMRASEGWGVAATAQSEPVQMVCGILTFILKMEAACSCEMLAT
jgi:hypothetical protein